MEYICQECCLDNPCRLSLSDKHDDAPSDICPLDFYDCTWVKKNREGWFEDEQIKQLKEVAKQKYELIVSQAEEIAELRKVNKNLRQALTPWVMED